MRGTKRQNIVGSGLFLFLLLVAALPLGVSWWRINTPSRHSSGGVWKTDAVGERATLNSLSIFLKREPTPNIVAAAYTIPEHDSVYLPQVRSGTRQYREWVYYLEYNRRDKTLTKRLFTTLPIEWDKPNRVWVWENVSEDAIHKVAAPVRAMKTVSQIEAYKGGNLSELRRYGARLREETPGN